ncbi:MAG TPA: pantoate--beta-alanine ligase [Thermoanaerobaculaceae bacterium]|nr:pantoate--beta-alanine ligase [Thermoanaerobaculaceae bacterium]HRS17315.1 pantoate--beta-alanine ligase [Thermoanaerobaculaceae bacterium]
MLLITTIAGVRARRRELWQQGRTVAFVPTMGALHEGHLRLVDRARELADEVWASVFVNPTQFGPGEDFERYPRDLERDRALLAGRGVALLFAPGVKEMYPRPPATVIDLPELASGLCGAFRPGHFRGVALVVTKLLAITQPEWAVFGAKDWQQAAIIRRLVEDLDVPVRVEVAPTVREPDGLAMSSRNAYLGPDERRAATVLARALRAGEAAIAAGERDGEAVRQAVAAVVAAEPLAQLQYAAVVDPDSLQPLSRIDRRALLALAVHIGTTRLIDNLLVEVS